jgi:hypothetical protein
MSKFDTLLLRWSIGTQNTVVLDAYKKEEFLDFLWLAKLSIVSFQKFFPGARFVVFYNGNYFNEFRTTFESISPEFLCDVEYVDQTVFLSNHQNPYHFFPLGVWYKWIPFRYDINYNEVSVDTDIICLTTPFSWYKWLESNCEIIIAPERFEKIKVNTCGDLHNHPILKGKPPLNCGIVGHRTRCDYSDDFFDITKSVKFGQTHDSLFITEQGTINIWAYSMALKGKSLYVLDFEKNAWIRDFIYYLEKGQEVETIHAVSWHKKIAKQLKEVLERRVFDDNYSRDEFLLDLLRRSKEFNFVARKVIQSQLGIKKEHVEVYFAK